ncbi:MAG: hypothetical protein AB1485_00060 [Candidatus Thermoplasmatota archaeon]
MDRYTGFFYGGALFFGLLGAAYIFYSLNRLVSALVAGVGLSIAWLSFIYPSFFDFADSTEMAEYKEKFLKLLARVGLSTVIVTIVILLVYSCGL